MTAPRIIYAGTPDFAVPALSALLENSDVVAVYTQPDRPAGRGRKPAAPAVKERALQAGLPVLQPTSLKGEDAQRELAGLRPDLLVVAAYGLILPQAVLDIPDSGVSTSMPPCCRAWRGAAPIQRALLAGDTRDRHQHHAHGSWARHRPGLRGGCLGHRPTPTPAATLTDGLARLGAESLMAALPGILDGSGRRRGPRTTPRPPTRRSCARRRRASTGRSPAEAIARWCAPSTPGPSPNAARRRDVLRIWSRQPAARCRAPDPVAAPPPAPYRARPGAGVCSRRHRRRHRRWGSAHHRAAGPRQAPHVRPPISSMPASWKAPCLAKPNAPNHAAAPGCAPHPKPRGWPPTARRGAAVRAAAARAVHAVTRRRPLTHGRAVGGERAGGAARSGAAAGTLLRHPAGVASPRGPASLYC
jgi:methionyl-tRNA formyltransferase